MRFKTILSYLLVIILIAAALFQSLFIGLPLIAETMIKKHLPPVPEGFSTEFSIKKIGPFQTVLHDIRMGKDIHVNRVVCDYTWGGPNWFQLDKVAVSGLSTRLQVDDAGGVTLNGRSLPGDGTQPDQGNKSGPSFPVTLDLSPFMPFIPERVVVTHINTKIEYQGRSILLPARFNARIYREEGRVGLHGEVTPFGQRVSFEAAGDLVSGFTRLRVSADDFFPGFLTAFIKGLPEGTLLGGPVNFALEKSLDGPWGIDFSGLQIIGENKPRIDIDNVTGHINEMPKNEGGG
ncbi:MAG: hypothetical protein MI802_02325, partial [Desulfobacterales bacterium]|nr:hypothetical protein [Desulfobacterales bacterium]